MIKFYTDKIGFDFFRKYEIIINFDSLRIVALHKHLSWLRKNIKKLELKSYYKCECVDVMTYNKLKVGSLITVPLTRNFVRSFFSVPKSQYSLYFLKGNDQRELNLSHEKEIFNLIESSDLKTSSFIYNSYEARRKYQAWTKAFPWIKPHYAIKANPAQPLLQDLI